MATAKAGRPRAFDRHAALRSALELFWHGGYSASSLDDLTAAMGISRSSFYSSFASKHAVLLESLETYTTELLGEMRKAVAETSDPSIALEAVLHIVACTAEPAHGCYFINSVAELLPKDAQVAELAHRYLGEVNRLVATLLRRLGLSQPEARKRSGALLALATGAVMLRKAGQPAQQIDEMLSLHRLLLT